LTKANFGEDGYPLTMVSEFALAYEDEQQRDHNAWQPSPSNVHHAATFFEE
jgi:hypothetical protein